MFHSRERLLYNKEKPWVKKEGNGFDVSMGGDDGAEIFELIGIFILSLIEKRIALKILDYIGTMV